ncbi:MAG: UDP-4-amino-4,6-dideoxy-N-acetyl-beta-L-altrosamine transaminase [Alphaproteobacteria bacterium]
MKTYGYGHQTISQSDIDAVSKTLTSDFLTCGPAVKAFEQAVCDYTGAKYCVAVSNATAGLHIAALAAGLKKGDEAITTPITFLSSANCICFVGAFPVFADIDSETANIDPQEIEKHITEKTKVLIPVHFAGQSCDMETISKIAKKHHLIVIEDAAHAIGSDYKATKVGSCAYSDMTIFSFHPVKTITTGEGGAVTTNSKELYDKLCAFRAHGMHKDGDMKNTWEYEMRELGYNYRMTDFQAALGISQLKKLNAFKQRRREIVDYYNKNLGLPHLIERDFSNACFHLYPVLVQNRRDFYFKAREKGLNLQVHYIPVHTQPYYAQFGYKKGDFPKAENYYERCISLPLYPTLTDEDLAEIVKRLKEINV